MPPIAAEFAIQTYKKIKVLQYFYYKFFPIFVLTTPHQEYKGYANSNGKYGQRHGVRANSKASYYLPQN